MSTISVKLHFAAGHRILGLDGSGAKCRNIHGHTFHVTWTFIQGAGETTLEFGDLKTMLRGVLVPFDHTFILHCYDDFEHYLKANDLKYYLTDTPPTTECIAQEIGRLTIQRMTKGRVDALGAERPAPFPDARLYCVEVEEGPENSAMWQPEMVVPEHLQHIILTEAST